MTSKRKTVIDWNGLRERLAQSRLSMERLSADDAGHDEQLLRERATALAAPVGEAAESADESIEVLCFQTAGERYAVEAIHVAQVYPMSRITTIPGLPDFVVGIIAARGEVLSVIDLRSLLDLPLAQLIEPAASIMLQSEEMEFGVLAEDILGVERYPLQTLERSLPTLGSVEKTYLKGVATDRTAILDAERLLSDPRLIVETA